MRYEHILTGIFLSRPNRFIAHVEITEKGESKTVICHVKNTGRCKELLIPGVQVVVQFHPEAAAAGRKTSYSLIGVYKIRENLPPLLINMDSQAPNTAAFQWLQNISLSVNEKGARGIPDGFSLPSDTCRIDKIKREVTWGQSRFDLAFQIIGKANGKETITPAFMEVKGVTLESNGLAMFPDAPTIRGVKHMEELAKAVKEGYEEYILFVIQMKEIYGFQSNDKTHPEFGRVLKEVCKSGVHVMAFDCQVGEDFMEIKNQVPVLFP